MSGELPLPGQYRMFRFDSDEKAEEQVTQLAEFVCHKNYLYNAIEMIAMKYPFASGVGRRTHRQADDDGPATPAEGDLALDASAKGLITALKKIPRSIADRVFVKGDENTLAYAYVDIWNQDDHYFRQPDTADEDSAIIAEMSPEGRQKLVLGLLENCYNIEHNLIVSKFPIIQSFDPYLVNAMVGRAGGSIAAMAAPTK